MTTLLGHLKKGIGWVLYRAIGRGAFLEQIASAVKGDYFSGHTLSNWAAHYRIES